jgi:adenosylcobinamide-phosphate synthase
MVPAEFLILFSLYVLAAALILDRLTGDPKSALHPVALLGRFIAWWGRPDRYPPRLQRAAGVLFWCMTVFLCAAPIFLFLKFAPLILILIGAPLLLKCCFAWRSLEDHLATVTDALGKSTEAGREAVKMLVSRETSSLSYEQVLSAAYESLSENLTDSIVSPLFYYALFGLVGAVVFRAANTMDAMLGYRDERERLGWCSARADDILNYLPARITVLFLLLYFTVMGRFSAAYRIMRRDGKNRPGYNGGIVMGAMAGGLGIRFEKPGVYAIGDADRPLPEGGGGILRAVRAVALMAALSAAGTLFLLGSWINSMGI